MEAGEGSAEGAHAIAVVTEADLVDLLALVRAYCDFYETSPSDQELIALSRALIADPGLEGVQLIARGGNSQAVAFATVFWSWDTTEGGRIGILNDLFVTPEARGSGVAGALIAAARERCAGRGALRLEWVTGLQNVRAQSLYDRIGAVREDWASYWLATRPG